MDIENQSSKCSKSHVDQTLLSSREDRISQRYDGHYQPTQQDLNDAISLIQQQIPNRSLQKAIQMMFDYIVKQKPPEKVFCDYIPPLLHIPQAPKNYRYASKKKSELCVTFKKDQLEKKEFESAQEKSEYNLMRLVAKSYVVMHEQDFKRAKQLIIKWRTNAAKAGNEGTFVLDPIKYKQLLRQCFMTSFKELQDFLLEYAIIKLKHLPLEDVAKIADIILNKKATNYLHVIEKYLRYSFGLSGVTLNQVESVELYLYLLKNLYRKRVDVEGIELYFAEYFQTKKITIPTIDPLSIEADPLPTEADRFIYQNYKEFKSFVHLFSELHQKFNLSRSQSRERLQFLLKKSIQQVISQSSKLGIKFPVLSLDDDFCLLQNIISLKKAEDLRVNLLEFYINPTTTSQVDLFVLIELLKEFLSEELLPSDEVTSFFSEEETMEETHNRSDPLNEQ